MAKKVEGNIWQRLDKEGTTQFLYRRLLPIFENGKKGYRDFRRILGPDLAHAVKEAKKLDEECELLLQGQNPKEAITLGEYFDWYTSHLKDEKKLLGWYTPIGHLRVFVECLGRAKNLKKINRVDVESFLLLRRGEVGPVTVAGYYRSIRRMLNVAIKLGYLEQNPALGLTLEKQGKREPRIPTVEEVRSLLDYLKTRKPRMFSMVMALLFTGGRLGEILSLNWSCIDFTTGQITLIRRKVNDEHRLKIAKPLSASLYEMWMESGMPKEGLVFLGKTGEQINRHCLSRSFKKVVKKLGMQYLTLKVFRKVAATWVVQGSHDVRAAQLLLGHSNIRTTEIYLGGGTEAKELAVDTIERRLTAS